MGQEFSLHAATNPPPAGGANGDVVSDLNVENPDMNTVHGALQVWNQDLENLHETLEAWSAEFDEVRQTFEVWSLQFDRLITTLGYERRNGLIIASTTTSPPNTPGLTDQDNQIHAILNDDNGAILNSDSSEEFMAIEQTASVSHGTNRTLDAEITIRSDLGGLNETCERGQLESPTIPIDSSLPAQDPSQVITWPNTQDAPRDADPPSSGTEGDANTNQPEQETDNSLKRRAESDPASAASVGILIPVKKTAAPAPGNEQPAPKREVVAVAPEVEGTEGREDELVIVNSTDEVVNNIETDPITSTTPVSSG